MANKLEAKEDLIKCYKSLSQWTSTCDTFLQSHFLLCEHIIYGYEKIHNSTQFFSEVCQQKYCPFWVKDQLSLRQECRKTETGNQADDENSSELVTKSEFDYDSDTQSESECKHQNESYIERNTRKDELENNDDSEDIVLSHIDTGKILKEQIENGNFKLLEVFKANSKNVQFLAKARQRMRQRTMSKTWAQGNHPATMYLRQHILQ